jgi:hypothetical protein
LLNAARGIDELLDLLGCEAGLRLCLRFRELCIDEPHAAGAADNHCNFSVETIHLILR